MPWRQAVGTTITIDADASGFGWFIDTTPAEDSEFDGTPPTGIDLLTVLLHEIGHVLGFGHDSGLAVMGEQLGAGERTGLVEPSLAALGNGGGDAGPVSGMLVTGTVPDLTLDLTPAADDATSVVVSVNPDGTINVSGSAGDDLTSPISDVIDIKGNPNGSLEIVGPDEDVIWNLDAADSGSLTIVGGATITFSNVDTLTGGSGTDTLLGPDTATTWSVTADGSGEVAGVTFSGIENLSGGGGTDTLDFSGVVSELAVTLHVDGTLSVSAGGSVVQTIAGVENLIGGTGATTLTFEDGAGLVGTLSAAGGLTLNYTAYTSVVTVNLATGAATGTGGISNLTRVIGGDDTDTLIGPDAATTWNVTGDGSGEVAGVAYSGIENLTGGGSTDTLDLSSVAGDVTVTLHAAGGVSVSDGLNTVSNITGVENVGGSAGTTTYKFENAASVAGTLGGNAIILDYSAYLTSVVVDVASGKAPGTAGVSNVAAVVGGAGNDTFVMADGSVSGSISGGAGTDTLDYSGRLTGITVDLTSGTATGTGGISDIESVIGGAGDDTLIGSLNAVLVDTGAGADTLDFSNVSASLTMTLAANDTLTVTDGVNTVSGIRGVETVMGGLGDDTLVGLDTGGTWTLTGPNTGTLNGLSFSRIETLQGGTGTDTLFGPAIDTNWNITASDEGEVAGVWFRGIENLNGAANNQDTFSFEAAGSLSGLLEGGAAGFDTIVLNGGYSDSVVYTFTGPDSGYLERSPGDMITYSGFEPISTNPDPIGTNPTSVTLKYDAPGTLTVSESGGQITVTGTAAETISFDIPSSTLTIITSDGVDIVNVQGLGAFTGTLEINTGDETDTVNVQSTAAGSVTVINGGDSSDIINIGNAANSLSGILGEITVKGGDHDADTTTLTIGIDSNTLDSGDILNIYDQGDTGSYTYTLTDTTFTNSRTGAGTITYGTVETLNLNTASGAADLDVVNTAASVNTNITARDLADDIDVTTTGAASNVVINAGDGADTIDLAATGVGSFVQVNAGGGIDTLMLAGTDATSRTGLDGGADSDTFHLLNSATGNVDGGDDEDTFYLTAGVTITGTLTGGAGGVTDNDTLVAVGGTGPNTWVVNAADSGTLDNGGGSQAFLDIENLTGNANVDDFTFTAALTGTASGLGGNDVFRINDGGSAGTLDGGLDTDDIIVTTTTNQTLKLSDTTLAIGSSPVSIAITGFELAQLIGDVGIDDFEVANWSSSATLEGLAGNDTYRFGDDWGTVNIIDADGGTLDFSSVTRTLTVTQSLSDPSKLVVSDGLGNTVTYDAAGNFTTQGLGSTGTGNTLTTGVDESQGPRR